MVFSHVFASPWQGQLGIAFGNRSLEPSIAIIHGSPKLHCYWRQRPAARSKEAEIQFSGQSFFSSRSELSISFNRESCTTPFVLKMRPSYISEEFISGPRSGERSFSPRTLTAKFRQYMQAESVIRSWASPPLAGRGATGWQLLPPCSRAFQRNILNLWPNHFAPAANKPSLCNTNIWKEWRWIISSSCSWHSVCQWKSSVAARLVSFRLCEIARKNG